MKKITKYEKATDKDGLMTKERIQLINRARGAGFTSDFIRKYDLEWTKTVNRLKNAKSKEEAADIVSGAMRNALNNVR